MKKFIILSLFFIGIFYLTKDTNDKQKNDRLLAQTESFKDQNVHFSEKYFANHA